MLLNGTSSAADGGSEKRALAIKLPLIPISFLPSYNSMLLLQLENRNDSTIRQLGRLSVSVCGLG